MGSYGLKSTYDRVLCNERGEEFRCETFVEANRLRLSINADIDALTAERDELQRRLDAVVAKISEAVVSDDDCVCSMLCHSAIIAIAENE